MGILATAGVVKDKHRAHTPTLTVGLCADHVIDLLKPHQWPCRILCMILQTLKKNNFLTCFIGRYIDFRGFEGAQEEVSTLYFPSMIKRINRENLPINYEFTG